MRMLSGIRPTGVLHLGHYIGVLKKYSELQFMNENYFILSDLHMLTTRCSLKEIQKIKANCADIILDLICVGVDPENTNFYLQSNIPELNTLYMLLHNFVSVSRLKVNPALIDMSSGIPMDEIPIGLLSYPLMEACDIIGLQAHTVPVGLDNEDHLKVTQEVVERVNSAYNLNLIRPECITSESKSLIGTDGACKMSKSRNNSIYLSDSAKTLETKIKEMCWIPFEKETKHQQNPVINYLKIFETDREIVNALMKRFTQGECVEKCVKERLYECLDSLMAPMRERRRQLEGNYDYFEQLLQKGTEKTREIIASTLSYLKKGMGMYELT